MTKKFQKPSWLRPSSFVLRPSSFVLRPSSFVLRPSCLRAFVPSCETKKEVAKPVLVPKLRFMANSEILDSCGDRGRNGAFAPLPRVWPF